MAVWRHTICNTTCSRNCFFINFIHDGSIYKQIRRRKSSHYNFYACIYAHSNFSWDEYNLLNDTFDFLFWIISAYLLLRIVQKEKKKLWIWLGVVIGLGLLNKTSMLWLSSGVFPGINFYSVKKRFENKISYIAALIALVIFSPFIIWNITHDFAHLEFMRNAASMKYGGLTPMSFLMDQFLI